MAFWDRAEAIWNDSATVAWTLVIIGIAGALWTTFRPQSPGVSIGLLALAAGTMSVRPKMHTAEKFAWVAILIVFTILEVKAIGRGDKQNEESRTAQNNQFKVIAEALKCSIAQSQAQFKDTMDGIMPTLEAAKTAVNQTRPRAYVHYTDLGPIDNPPPSSFVANVSYKFQSVFANDGNDDAHIERALRRIYVGLPDDKSDQKRLADTFEKEWKEVDRDYRPGVLMPGQARYYTDAYKLKEEDFSGLSQGKTIYILRRVEYSDHTGMWTSEDCQHFQIIDKAFYMKVMHPCLVFNRARVSARQK